MICTSAQVLSSAMTSGDNGKQAIKRPTSFNPFDDCVSVAKCDAHCSNVAVPTTSEGPESAEVKNTVIIQLFRALDDLTRVCSRHSDFITDSTVRYVLGSVPLEHNAFESCGFTGEDKSSLLSVSCRNSPLDFFISCYRNKAAAAEQSFLKWSLRGLYRCVPAGVCGDLVCLKSVCSVSGTGSTINTKTFYKHNKYTNIYSEI